MNCYKCNQRMNRFKPDDNYKIECCQNKECKEYGKAYDIEKREPYKSIIGTT